MAAGPDRVRCPHCGGERQWYQQPLFCLTGASGAGKSTVAALAGPRLAARVMTLEQDVLWNAELADRPGGVRQFRATWLSLAAMIGQHGRPVLLCGTVVPAELEPLPERALFSRIEYLALLVDPMELADRLAGRPAWRAWDDVRIAETVAFAAGLPALATSSRPPMETLDTTGQAPTAVVDAVVAWVDRHLGADPDRDDSVTGS